MSQLVKIFEDKKFLSYVIKTAAVIGPGFLAIGYFERELFLELDWLKLISISIIFSVVFVMPILVVSHLTLNFNPWISERQLNKIKKQITAEQLKLASNKARLKAVLPLVEERVGIDISKAEKAANLLLDRIEKDKRTISSYRTDFYSLLTDGPSVFFILFLIVISQIALDYIFEYEASLRDLVVLLLWDMWAALPLLSVGVFLVSVRNLLSKRSARLMTLFVAIIIIVVSLVILFTKVKLQV